MTKLLYLEHIQDCIDQRIKQLAKTCNEDENKIKGNYVHRVNILQQAHQYKTIQDNYSHYMVKAWQGTQKQFIENDLEKKCNGCDEHNIKLQYAKNKKYYCFRCYEEVNIILNNGGK